MTKRIMVKDILKMLFVTSILLLLFGCNENKRSDINSFQLKMKTKTLYMNSTSHGIMLTDNGITLENQLLIEDDAPACGFSNKEEAIEVLKEGIVIKKILRIEKQPVAPARIAMLVYPDFPSEPNNGRHLIFNVNGHEIKYEVKHFWTDVPVPISYLHKGNNVITVHTLESDTRFKTWVALDENYHIGSTERLSHPNRSARSIDGGKTWDFDHLGEKGIVDGEYSIRLKLSNYPSSGWLQSPIIDMAENSNIDGIKVPVIIEKATVKLQKDLQGDTQIELKARTGSTHFIDENNWNDWKDCTNGGIPQSLLKNRFIQFKIIFVTHSPADTPLLKNIDLETQYKIENDSIAQDVQVVGLVNKPRISSSYNFEYENPLHPKLKELRRKYKLDDVVKGANSEFEKMLKLKSWVAKQWNWHLPGPEDGMIKWDALDILKTDKNGNVKGGFCLHYAIVYMQVLQSFGFNARVVNTNYAVWGGHEMTEVWSNQFGKWILMDPEYDTYFANKKSGVPLNTLELHNLFLEKYYPNEAIDRDNWSREDFIKRVQSNGAPQSIVCMVGGGAQGGKLKEYKWLEPTVDLPAYCQGMGFLNTGYFRLLPRSNFLSEEYPIPVNHGRLHWGWTGYYCWYDKQTPRVPEFNQFTNRPNDLYWNLNEVDFSAEMKNEGELLITFTTNSPNFDHYEFKINGSLKKLKENHYLLNLTPGRNYLEMYVVDIMNNKGQVSVINVTYSQKKIKNEY